MRVLSPWEPHGHPALLEQQPYEHNSRECRQRIPVYTEITSPTK